MFVTVCGGPPFIRADLRDPHFAAFLEAAGQVGDMLDVGCRARMAYHAVKLAPRQRRVLEIHCAESRRRNKRFPWPSGLSPPFVDVLSRMLRVSPDRRITSEDLLNHPLFRDARSPLPPPTLHSSPPRGIASARVRAALNRVRVVATPGVAIAPAEKYVPRSRVVLWGRRNTRRGAQKRISPEQRVVV